MENQRVPLNKLLSSIQSNPAITGVLGGAAGGALVSAFTKKKSAKNLLKAGGLVAVGGLAYKAYQSYRNSQTSRHTELPLPEISQQQFADVVEPSKQPTSTTVVLQSMIAAAHADKKLTGEEQEKIWQQKLKSIPQR